MKDTYNRVVEIFGNYEHNSEPVKVSSPQNGLYDDLGLDSLAVVELVMLCENEFEIHFDDDEIKHMTKVQDYVDIINRELAK